MNCKIMEQDENRENSPRRSWATTHLGNVGQYLRTSKRRWLPGWCGRFLMLGFLLPVRGAELISNKSVEKFHGYYFLPGWDVAYGNAAGVNTTSANAHSGSNSLEFDLSVGNGSQWGHETFAVLPGETNRASFWYKVNATLSGGEIAAVVRWWGDPSRSSFVAQTILQTGIGQTPPGAWMSVTQLVTVPANAAFADLLLDGASSVGPAGLVFFDDFSFAPLNAAATITNSIPADGASDVQLYTVLQWQPAQTAKNFQLYLGTNYPALAAAATNSADFLDTVRLPAGKNTVRYAVTLRPDQQYFWRVDAVNDGGNTFQGGVQSFATGFNYLENVTTATASRFDSKDNTGAGLDTIKILQNPAAPGYIGVCHYLVTNQFQVRLALSTNLLNWTFVRTLEPNGSQPTLIYHPQSGGFILAHEQWSLPGSTGASQLRFRYYPSYADLLAGNFTRSFLAPISSFHWTALEGTPNFFTLNADGNVITAGFHFYSNEGVDQNAWGTLSNLLSGVTTWTTQIATDLNETLINRGVYGNIGDRDFGRLFGFDYLWQEGQYVGGDFGTWRAWFYDYGRSNSFALFPKTPKGSRSFGNGTFGFLTAPSGKPAVVAAYFIFGEQAGSGEAGQLIFYTEISTAAAEFSVIPASTFNGWDCYLRWVSGAGAMGHDLYLGTNAASVTNAATNSPLHLGRLSKPHAVVPGLAPNTTYYVRVDEVAAGNSLTSGPLWSFATPALPRFTSVAFVGGIFTAAGVGGSSNGSYIVLASKNLVLPTAQWEPVATNRFDAPGNFMFSNTPDPALSRRFLRLRLP